MNKKLLILILGVSFFACSSPTKIANSWHDPSVTIQKPYLHKIVVAALLTDQVARRIVEDYMVTLYPGSATQSYKVLSEDSIPGSEDVYSQKLKSDGFDGLVIMKQVNMTSSERFVPTQPTPYYSTWGGYWRGGWGYRWPYWGGWGGWGRPMYDPNAYGYTVTDKTWNVQVNAYSLASNKLVYTANTYTTNPGGKVPLFEDVCQAVKKQMAKDGFLQ